jgi:chromosome segregation ATPase
MADIAELEQRIKDALARIGAGVDQLGEAAANAALEEALEAEKMTSAQLEERIRALHQTHEADLIAAKSDAKIEAEAAVAAAQTKIEELEDTIDQMRAKLRELRDSNQRLTSSITSLRETNAQEIEPHLINHAMMSELEALKAARARERGEIDQILTALKPMLEEREDA